jgi:hypothetical protein
MGEIFKIIFYVVGRLIVAGLMLLLLWVAVKLFIFLIAIFSIVIGVVLVLTIAIGLVVFVFWAIKALFFKKDSKKKTQ